jgi:2-methylcitrate dehydratase PrpD
MLTRALADFAVSLDYARLPEAVRLRARMSLLDGLAIMLGAVAFARHTGDRRLENYIDLTGTPGPATAIGHGRRLPPLVAAFVNGTLSEVLDFSDCILTARNHPGATILPSVLALIENRTVSGQALVAAMMAAYEVHTRICHAIQPSHWWRGFQCTGTIGTCGAAVGAAHVLGLDAARMADALGASGFVMPVSNGDNVFRGHSIKPVHGGQAATAGLSAAFLAAAGFSAGPLEGEPPRHHAALRLLADAIDDERALADLGSDWRCLELAYKPYPIGLLNIGPVEICLDVYHNEKLHGDDIERIEVITYKEAAHFVGKFTTPESSYIDCYLSLPYCVAVSLYDGVLGVKQLEDERVRDPKVHDLARRVVLTEDPAMSARYPHEWPVAITFHTSRGSTFSRRVDAVRWSPRRPPAWDDLVAKFMGLAEPVIGRARAERTIDFVGTIDAAEDAAPLMALVR